MCYISSLLALIQKIACVHACVRARVDVCACAGSNIPQLCSTFINEWLGQAVIERNISNRQTHSL